MRKEVFIKLLKNSTKSEITKNYYDCGKFTQEKVKKETFLKKFGDKRTPFYWKFTVDCEDGNANVYFGDITYEIKLNY